MENFAETKEKFFKMRIFLWIFWEILQIRCRNFEIILYIKKKKKLKEILEGSGKRFGGILGKIFGGTECIGEFLNNSQTDVMSSNTLGFWGGAFYYIFEHKKLSHHKIYSVKISNSFNFNPVSITFWYENNIIIFFLSIVLDSDEQETMNVTIAILSDFILGNTANDTVGFSSPKYIIFGWLWSILAILSMGVFETLKVP